MGFKMIQQQIFWNLFVVSIATSVMGAYQGCSDNPLVDCQHYSLRLYCNDPNYKKVMISHCAFTCNFCGNDDASTISCENVQPTQSPNAGKCGVPSPQKGRIIAGSTAKPGAWPWQALIYANGKAHCGGSLIAPDWVVTAAHCVNGYEHYPSMFRLTLGEHNYNIREGTEQYFGAKKIISYPTFTMRDLEGDIALIKLDRPVKMNSRVLPVCLPKKGQSLAIGQQCYISGFGKISPHGHRLPVLQQAKMPVVDSHTCNRHNQASGEYVPRVTKFMLCAGDGGLTRKSGCHGDSGGPFVCQTGPGGSFELHGVVSFGSSVCDSKSSYSMFARVSELRTWIDFVMSKY